jgi:hypothetical protein
MVLIAAGCASNTNDRNAALRECGYTYDYPVRPPSALTPGEVGDPIPYRINTGAEISDHPAPYLVSRIDFP